MVKQYTNEAPGTRAKLRNLPTSAYKVRQVLNLIRGKRVEDAQSILALCERGSAVPVGKLLDSAVANAVNNDGQSEDELFVAACFADEGTTGKRFQPRAKGRAGRIRKRTSHVTMIVARLSDEEIAGDSRTEENERARRVASSRAARTQASKKRDAELAAEEPEEEVTTPDEKGETSEAKASEGETVTKPKSDKKSEATNKKAEEK